MDDLVQLNRSIAKHWLGSLNADQEEYLRFVSVCLGQLIPGAAELTGVLAQLCQWARRYFVKSIR